MISSGDSIRSDATAALGGGGLVRDNSTKTAGVKGTGGRGGGGGSNGSDDGSGYLLEIMQNRAHFDGDDDDDDDDDDDEDDEEEEKEEEIGASDQKTIGAKGNAVVRSVPPRAAPPRPGGRAAGTPRRHRKRPSRDSISSLVAAESVGIVATIAAARPTATSTAAGTGVVARAVARVEDRPEDEAVKSILAKAAQKQLAEDAARARNKMLAPPRVREACFCAFLCIFGLVFAKTKYQVQGRRQMSVIPLPLLNSFPFRTKRFAAYGIAHEASRPSPWVLDFLFFLFCSIGVGLVLDWYSLVRLHWCQAPASRASKSPPLCRLHERG